MFRTRTRLFSSHFVLLMLFLVLGLAPRAAQAASYVVTSTADNANSTKDPTTLRGAIAASQASPDASDTITINTSGTVTLTQGELLISNPNAITGKTVTIKGPGAGSFTVNGNRLSGTHGTRVLEITGGTVNLSGITITEGLVSTGATGGAGVLLEGATLTMAHCVVSSCLADVSSTLGGGVANVGGDLTLTSCVITGNGLDSGGDNGAGGVGSQDGSLTMTGCTVNGNDGVGQGGGIASYRETCVLSRCTITGNYVSGDANSMSTEGDGGGVYSSDDDLTMTDCTISGNSSNDAGYGMYLVGGAGKSVDLIRCTLSGNQFTIDVTGPFSTPFQQYGAAIFNASAVLSLTNCTLYDNTDQGAAGGIYNAGVLTLTDCTLTRNVPGGLDNAASGTATVTSSILVGNTNSSNVFTAKAGAIKSGGSNLIGDPNGNGFVNDPNHADPNSTGNHDQTGVTQPNLGLLASNGGQTQTVALNTGSPAIDGDFADATPTDQRGATRPFGTRNDIGAFEYGATAPPALVDTYIVTNTHDSGAGSLRQAISDANADPGSAVVFEPSVFGPGKPQTITLTSGLLYITQNMTVTGPGASLLSISGGNRSPVLAIGGTTTVSGLTFTEGNSGSQYGTLGGGLSIGGNVTMTDCVISNCTAPGSNSIGGGLFVGGSATLNRCVITGNSAPNGSGGGIAFYGSYTDLTLNDCTVSKNTAKNDGGGLYVGLGQAQVNTTTISGNSAATGGGIYDSDILFLDLCTIADNTATDGGGFYTIGTSALLLNSCTVTANKATTSGGLDNTSTNDSIIIQSILAGNTGGNVTNTPTGKITSEGYNLIGDPNGNGFTNGVNGDITGVTNPKLGPLQNNGGPTETIALLPGSPAIDAIPTTEATGSNTDQRGAPRPEGKGIDIGAYEYGAPTAHDDAYTVQENKTLTIQAPGVLSNDTADGSNPVLTATLEDKPLHGSLMFNHDGSFAYTPNTGFLGTDTFTYQVADAGVAGTNGTVTLTVVGIVITPPTTTVILNPATPNGLDGYYTVPVTVTLKTTLATGDPGPATTFYSLDGAAQKTYTAPIKVSTDGVHTLSYFSSTPQSGAETTKTLKFAIDATPPVTTGSMKAVTGGTQVMLSAKDNVSGVASTVYTLDGGSTQTYTAPFTVTSTTAHTVIYHSTDKAGNVEKAQTLTVASGTIHTFASGLQMFSVPADYSSLTLGESLIQSGTTSAPTLAVWMPSLVNYVLSPTAPADHLLPGQGYWVKLNGTGSLSSMGTPTPTSAPFNITLGEGWNMIGDPFNSTINLSNVVVMAGGKSYTGISAASSAGVVSYILYSYPAGSTAYVSENGTGILAPYVGYWVYAFQPCTLTIIAP